MNEEAEGLEWEKKPGKKLEKKSQRIAWRIECQKEESWKWMPPNENGSFSSSKKKLERMCLLNVAKGISWYLCQGSIKGVMGIEDRRQRVEDQMELRK